MGREKEHWWQMYLSAGQAAELDGTAASVWACRSVDATIGQAKTLDGVFVDQMRFDDFVYVFGSDEPVPDLLRVDDQSRTVLALIETAGIVDANHALQTVVVNSRFEGRTDFFGLLGRTATTRMGIRSFVDTDENMSLKNRHS